MRIGVPKEIKTDEYRVALTPAGARELIQRGHEVLVEATAGEGSAFPDEQYERAGARIVSVDDAWGQADLLLKVKEPIEQQVGLQVWTSYFALQTATRRLATSRDLLASAQESANVAAERYRAGVGNIIDLLTAEAALEVARAQEVQARADWFVSIAQLAHDTGTLTK